MEDIKVKKGDTYVTYVVHGQPHNFGPIACNMHDPNLDEIPGDGGYDPDCSACRMTARATLENIVYVDAAAARGDREYGGKRPEDYEGTDLEGTVHYHQAILRVSGEHRERGSKP